MTDKHPLISKDVVQMLRDPSCTFNSGYRFVAANEIERLQGQLREMEARAIAAIYLVPVDKVCGELQALRDKAKRLLQDETSDVENLKNAIAAMRSTRDEMQRRLIEQDAELERYRANCTGRHGSQQHCSSVEPSDNEVIKT